MNQINTIKKEDYIIDKSIFNETKQICLICLEIVNSPVECTVCKSLFCKLCASNWKNSIDKCPKKCSSPWNFIKSNKSKKIKFKCPFNQSCSKLTSESFYNHLYVCQHTKNNFKQVYRQKTQYLCNYNHSLIFLHGEAAKIQKKCSSCQYKIVCRSKCQTCESNYQQCFYCGKCRSPPIYNQFCPRKFHKFRLRTSMLQDSCGICGIHPIYLKQNIYSDELCQFGLCCQCYKIYNPNKKYQYKKKCDCCGEQVIDYERNEEQGNS